VATGGFLWLAQIDAHSAYWTHVFGPACLIALALGVLFTPLAAAATTGVAPTEAGLASGVLNTARQMGGSVGLAGLATVAIDRTHALLKVGPGYETAAAALTSGYARAFVLGTALALAAFVASWIVPSLRGGSTAPRAAAPAVQPQPAAEPA
jgi:hypothetical protein